MIYKNVNTLTEYLPEIRKNFILNNHDLKLKYEKKTLQLMEKVKLKLK